jgi:hypothetical protein
VFNFGAVGQHALLEIDQLAAEMRLELWRHAPDCSGAARQTAQIKNPQCLLRGTAGQGVDVLEERPLGGEKQSLQVVGLFTV